MNRMFTCAACHGTFESDDEWTMEKKNKEAEEQGFGLNLLRGDVATVCDDCYLAIAKEFHFTVKPENLGK